MIRTLVLCLAFIASEQAMAEMEEASYQATGHASWYGPGLHGRKTASGERFDKNSFTAAHKTLPMNSFVRVTNLANDESIVVKINDRGPFSRGRLIDLSQGAARALGIHGVAQVEITALD
ncbi:MAG: septal ring lytic transglycosylase RlpA family protein [Methylococcaceae bacterium]|jgi:rare lipoprotein A